MTQEEGVMSKDKHLGNVFRSAMHRSLSHCLPTPNTPTFNTLLCEGGSGIQTSEEGSVDFLDLVPLRRGREVGSGSRKEVGS